MKTLKIFLSTLALLLTVNATAQTTIQEIPGAITYEATVLDANGEKVSNQSISLRITILHDSPTGTADWVERHQPTTNAAAYIRINIGEGQRTGGDYTDFNSIDWEGAHFLKVEMDITGGNNFVYSSTEEFTSVPYAFRAAVADSLAGFDRVMAGGCNCTLQEAYNNGNVINLSGVPVSIFNNNTATTPYNFVSYSTSTNGSSIAGDFFTQHNSNSNWPTVRVTNYSTTPAAIGIWSRLGDANFPSPNTSYSIVAENINNPSGYAIVASNYASVPGIYSVNYGLAEAGFFTTPFMGGTNPNSNPAFAIRGEVPANLVNIYGGAGDFYIGNSANVAQVVRVQTDGLGQGITVSNKNLLNPSPSVQIETNGIGRGISALHNGTAGVTSHLETMNSTNNSHTLNVVQRGTGLSGNFELRNSNSTRYVTEVNNYSGRGNGGYFATRSTNNLARTTALRAVALREGRAAWFSNTTNSTSLLAPMTFFQQNGLTQALRLEDLNPNNTTNSVDVFSRSMGRTFFTWNASTTSTANVAQVVGDGLGSVLVAQSANNNATTPVAAFRNFSANTNAGLGGRATLFVENNAPLGAGAVFTNNHTNNSHITAAVFNWSANNLSVGISSATQAGEAAIMASASNTTMVLLPVSSLANTSNTLEVFKGLAYAARFHGEILTDNGVYRQAGLSSSFIKDAAGTQRTLHAEESPEVWFTDYGSGQLVNGLANITFDAMFAGSINTSSPYHVFIQLEGACTGGAYVSNKTATGFTVQQQDGNSSNAAFSYRITAKRKHYENLRFATEEQTRTASQAELEQVWPEVIEAGNQKRQNALAKLNAPLNNYTAAQPDVFTEPPAVTEETVPEVTEPAVPAITPTPARNYAAPPQLNIPFYEHP